MRRRSRLVGWGAAVLTALWVAGATRYFQEIGGLALLDLLLPQELASLAAGATFPLILLWVFLF